MTKLTKPPLPFRGNKYMWGGRLLSVIEATEGHAVYLDLFGGSGYISNLIKQHNPESKVVYNDFDNYTARLDKIPQTRAIHAELKELLHKVERASSIKLQPKVFAALKKYISALPEDTDWITVGNWLLFSGKYATGKTELIKMLTASCWNNLTKSPPTRGDYLTGVIRESGDWQKILAKYQSCRDLCVIADPPYLYTDSSGYNSEISAAETIDLFAGCLQRESFLIFTTGRLDIIDLSMRINPALQSQCGKLVRHSQINAKQTKQLSEICYYR